MVPPVASSINFDSHPSIKTTQDPLVKKLSLNEEIVLRHNAPAPTLYEDGLLEKGNHYFLHRSFNGLLWKENW